MSALRQRENELQQMEAENLRMEERLKELKQSMKRNKKQRDKQGSKWGAGKSGGIATHAKGVLQENGIRRQRGKRMTVVTAEQTALASKPQQPRPPKSSRKKKASSSDVNPSATSSSGSGAMLDGEFDEAESHASFLEAVNEWRRGGSAAEPEATAAAGGDPDYPKEPTEGGGKLLDGPVFDEAASHAAFAAAVAAWRSGDVQESEKPAVKTWSMPEATAENATLEVQTAETPLEIEFTQKSQLSFMEKLLLKKSRRDGPSAADESLVVKKEQFPEVRARVSSAALRLCQEPTASKSAVENQEPDQVFEVTEVSADTASNERDERDDQPVVDEPSDDEEECGDAATVVEDLHQISLQDAAATDSAFAMDFEALLSEGTQLVLSPTDLMPSPHCEAAAVKIQSVERGRQARKLSGKLRRRKTENAATKIQAAFRGSLGRAEAKTLQEQKRRQEASVVIQRSYRGYQGRNEAQRLREERDVENKVEDAEEALRGLSGRSKKRRPAVPLPVPGQQRVLQQMTP